jgi:hypothetical protein
VAAAPPPLLALFLAYSGGGTQVRPARLGVLRLFGRFDIQTLPVLAPGAAGLADLNG